MTNRTGPGVSWVAGLVRGAIVSVGVAIAPILPALADSGLPPLEYDIGGETEEETLWRMHGFFDDLTLTRVPIDEVFATCSGITTERYGWPYPASEVAGARLLGCYIHDKDGSRPVIVYPIDPKRPELTNEILRHEMGHLLGWPNDHRRTLSPLAALFAGED